MAQAFNKEIVRSIKGSIGRFIAIVVISFLGAGVYAGLRMSAPDMRIAGDEFFDATALYDISVISDLGLDDESLDLLRQVEGVDQVMGAYRGDAMAAVDGKSFVATLESIPEAAVASDTSSGTGAVSDDPAYLNRPILEEGEWPQKADECAIGAEAAQSEGLAVGDTLVLEGNGEELEDTFAQTEFTIVGLVTSPAYVSDDTLGVTDLGGGKVEFYVYVQPQAFTEDYPITAAYITVAGAVDERWESPAYDRMIEEVKGRIEDIAPTIAQKRQEAIRADAQKELDEARATYEQERRDAEAQLSDASAELSDALAQLSDAHGELSSAKEALDNSKVTLDQTKAELDNAEARYAAGAADLESQRQLLQPGIDQLPALKAQRDALAADPSTPPEVLAELSAKIATIEAGQAALEEASQTLAQTRATLDGAWTQYRDGLAQYRAGLQAYNEGRQSYVQGQQDYESGKAEYQESKDEAEEGFAEAEDDLSQAQRDIDDIGPATVYVIDRTKNPGAASLSHDAMSITQIASLLPLLFFLVAALVVLTSMTRMVDEERLDIGTHKALGYGKARIISKYLIYGALASGIGSVLGVITMGKLLPWFIMTSYSIAYSIPIFPTPIDPWIAFKAIGLTIGVTLLATWGAVAASLRERPAQLMLPKAPKAGKRILLERIKPIWSRLSFSHKVTARNLLRYKARFFMAVIGIAGCTALLMVGFGLRDAIGGIVSNQYGQIMTYDAELKFSEDAQEGVEEAAAAALAGEEVDSYGLFGDANMVAAGPDGDIRFRVIIPQSAEELERYVHLRNRVDKEALSPTGDGIVITEKAASELGVSVGDTLKLYDEDDVGDRKGSGYDFKVAGIAENYLQHYAYMLPETYQRVIGEAPSKTHAFVNLTDQADSDDFIARQLENDQVETARLTAADIVQYEDMLGVMDKLIWVIVMLCAALAFVVLYNLTNINITERVREIATLKVLGFTSREVDMYIYREIIIMALIGALIGCVLGVPLTSYIAQAAETEAMMFGRAIDPLSFVFAFLITIAFAVVIALAMKPKLAKVNMVESLKSIE